MQIGIIAGSGELPEIIARDARDRGYKVVTIALEDLASPALKELSDQIHWINVGKIGSLIGALKDSGISEVIMAGKVPKSIIYKSKVVPDLRAIKLLFSLKDKNDDSILNAFSKELAGEGITVINTAVFSPNLLTPSGVLTIKGPSTEEWHDIEFGWRIAKAVGDLDIGQTVVVKGKAIMAVEAIEGTDEAIRRGGKWAGDGAVVVKVSKPQQDMRLDVPVVGPSTLQAMIDVKARVLAIEAERSIIIRRDNLIEEAENSGISIVGMSQQKAQ